MADDQERMTLDEAIAVVKYIDNQIELYFDRGKNIDDIKTKYQKSVEAARVLVAVCVMHQRNLEKMPNFAIDTDVAPPKEATAEAPKPSPKPATAPKPDPPKNAAGIETQASAGSATISELPNGKREAEKAAAAKNYNDEELKVLSSLYSEFRLEASRAAECVGFMVYAIPTREAAERFGFSEEPLIHCLFSQVQADWIRDKVYQFRYKLPYVWDLVSIRIKPIERTDMSGYNYVFDATQHQPEQFSGGHPVGRFQAVITATECAPNSANDGANFVVTFTTEAGDARKWYALWNSKQDTAKKAGQQLSALSHATGIYRIDMNNGGQALVGGKCMIEVGLQANSEQGYTEIKKVYDVNGNLPGKAGTNAGAGPQGGPQGGGMPPGAQMPQGAGPGPQGGGYPQQGGPQGYQQQPQQNGPQGGYQPGPQSNGYQPQPGPQGGYQPGPNQGYQPGPQGGPQGGYDPSQQGAQQGYQPQPQGGYQPGPQGGPPQGGQPPQGGGQWQQDTGGGQGGPAAPSWAS